MCVHSFYVCVYFCRSSSSVVSLSVTRTHRHTHFFPLLYSCPLGLTTHQFGVSLARAVEFLHNTYLNMQKVVDSWQFAHQAAIKGPGINF